MSNNTLDPKKQISDRLLALKKKNNAKSYAAWLNGMTRDARIDSSAAKMTASTNRALQERGIKASPMARGSGYGEYLLEKARGGYLNQMVGADNALEAAMQKSLGGYQSYIEGIENDRQKLVDSTFKTLLSLGITDIDEAYRRARGAGLTEIDAKDVARSITSATRTELYRKAISTIIAKYYTGRQAEKYAISIGLSSEDAHELERIANILNQLSSNPNYSYSSDYAKYIEELKNTTK